MAKTLGAGDGDKTKRGRGRPKKAEAMNGAAAGAMNAPGLGHNAPDEGVFLSWVSRIQAQKRNVDAQAALLKAEKGKMKDLRKDAQGAGLVMGELDEALADLETERVDLAAKEERRRCYREWLGLPAGRQTEAELRPGSTPAEQAAKWADLGNRAGRVGGSRDLPPGIPPEHHQDFLKAYDAGQEILMKASPLTAGAFKEADKAGAKLTDAKAGKAKAKGGKGEAEVAPEPVKEEKVVVLEAANFPGVEDIDEANLKTLDPAKLERWQAADRVVVVMDGKRRILKEPGYEDTGEPEVDLTNAEEVPEGATLEDIAAEVAGEPTPPAPVEPVVEPEVAPEGGEVAPDPDALPPLADTLDSMKETADAEAQAEDLQ